MLSYFQIERQFNKLRANIHVDRKCEEATLLVTYDRRIIRPAEPIQYWMVSTPELAEAWLGATIGERGSRIETLEWQCRLDLLAPVFV